MPSGCDYWEDALMDTLAKAKKEYEETIAAGNWAFAQSCFEVAILQAKEALKERKENEDRVRHKGQ